MSYLQFALDKSAAALYEGMAIEKVEEWYRSQGQRVHVRYNEENGLQGKRRFDLVDTWGKKWEVKADRKAGLTGNIFLEHIAIEHSEADFFIIFACGLVYILERTTLLELINSHYRRVAGGDDMRAGTLVPLSELNEIAFVI